MCDRTTHRRKQSRFEAQIIKADIALDEARLIEQVSIRAPRFAVKTPRHDRCACGQDIDREDNGVCSFCSQDMDGAY